MLKSESKDIIYACKLGMDGWTWFISVYRSNFRLYVIMGYSLKDPLSAISSNKMAIRNKTAIAFTM